MRVLNLVDRTVDLLAMSVGRPVDSQITPPVLPRGVSVVAPVNRVLTVGHLQWQVAGAAFPESVSKATAVHVPASHASAAPSEPVQHTKSDPAYLPFIGNNQRQFSIKKYFPKWVLADTGCVPVIMGSTMAKLCEYVSHIQTLVNISDHEHFGDWSRLSDGNSLT